MSLMLIARYALLMLVFLRVSAAADLPLVAHYPMDEANGFADAGGIGLDAKPSDGITVQADGRIGGGWHFSGKGSGPNRVTIGKEGQTEIIDMIGSPLSVALWVRPDAFPPANSHTVILSKRISFWQGYTFEILMEPNGSVSLSAQNGNDTVSMSMGSVSVGAWTHLSFTHIADGDVISYRDGVEMGRAHVDGTLSNNSLPLLVGNGDGNNDNNSRRTPFKGTMDDLRIYAATLNKAQISQLVKGESLPSRRATRDDVDVCRMPVTVRLVRFDMARGSTNRDGNEPQLSRIMCRRIDDQDPVDWPTMWLGDEKLFATQAEERVMVRRHLHQMGGPLFQQKDDVILHPGNHWFRPVSWMWGHTFIYTTDTTSRGARSELEVWTFPVIIRGADAGAVKQVTLRCGKHTLYQREFSQPVNSLTLCLPQNVPGPAYALSVNGSPDMTFNAGLKPVILGDPREVPLPVDLALTGNPAVTVQNLLVPEFFPQAHTLKSQTAEMRTRSEPWPQIQAAATKPSGFATLGVQVPRAPILTYAESLTHGMSGGFWLSSAHGPRGAQNQGKLFPADAEGYAAFLAGQNLDVIIEEFRTNGDRTTEALAAACERHGVQVGFNVVSINNPNLAYYSRALPDFWLPKVRDAQIVAQRVVHFPNFAGLTIGADNGGYVPYWDWAPPIPNRPWGEAFLSVNGRDKEPRQPIGPALRPNANKGYEVAGSQRDFVEYIQRYDSTFEQYGQFQQRIHEVDPSITLTTGSYGSGPGVGAQGGWPFASVNGEPMFRGLDVLQSYDWDETDAEKPLHNLALMDRLRSWYPDKPAWMLLDNFTLKYCREARQRVVALGLTRGLAQVGHNWMPQPTGAHASPQVCADEAEMWAWVHRYSGVYAGTRPRATIGIVFTSDQAISRPIANPRDQAQMLRGSHEGKVVEALLLCHLAGWPARIVTMSEIKRGLPDDMSALLLTGLNRFDDTWLWSDGSEAALKSFADRGGRFILDDESVLPAGLSGTKTAMIIQSTLPQKAAGPDGDKLALAVSRNRDNSALLRTAMQGIAQPMVVSDTPTVWAVPHHSGDVEYVTVTNWGSSPGRNAMHAYTPATAKLTWNTERPIYDVTASRLLSATDAVTCDLRKDAVRIYALPPGKITAPTLKLDVGGDGFVYATPTVTAVAKSVAGIPLAITITGPDGSTAKLWTASGRKTMLPIARSDNPGRYRIVTVELCAGQSNDMNYELKPSAVAVQVPAVVERDALARFFARSDQPLTLALTSQQRSDPALAGLVERLVAVCAAAGRTVEVKTLNQREIIVGPQTYTPAQPHPQWQTIPADLILIGDLRSNVLLYDQALGSIFPPEVYSLESGHGLARMTYSPFVGNYHCLNVLGTDTAALEQVIAALEATF